MDKVNAQTCLPYSPIQRVRRFGSELHSKSKTNNMFHNVNKIETNNLFWIRLKKFLLWILINEMYYSCGKGCFK